MTEMTNEEAIDAIEYARAIDGTIPCYRKMFCGRKYSISKQAIDMAIAALEAPDLAAALLTLNTEVTQLRSLCKAGGYEGVTIGQKKHAAAIAWAKEQSK